MKLMGHFSWETVVRIYNEMALAVSHITLCELCSNYYKKTQPWQTGHGSGLHPTGRILGGQEVSELEQSARQHRRRRLAMQ